MIHYTSERLGTLTIKRGEKKYKIQIRRGGNCLAVFVNVYREENPSDKKHPWVHQLYMFFNDENHIKNIMKEFNNDLLGDDVFRVELNTYYKESMTLIKYMTRCGYHVYAYYKEPKEKK